MATLQVKSATPVRAEFAETARPRSSRRFGGFGGFGVFGANLLFLFIFALATSARADTLLAEKFDRPKLDPAHFIEHYPGFSVAGGVLRASAAPQQKPFLNLLPAAGKNASLAFDFRWTGGEKCSLVVCADWRYNQMGPHVEVGVLADRGVVQLFRPQVGEPVATPIAKGQWVRLRFVRSGEELRAFAGEQELLATTLPPKTGSLYCDPAEANYGGFAIGLEPEPAAQQCEIDNLVVEGDPSPVAFRTLVQQFPLGDDPDYQFSAIYEADHETWARGQMQVNVPYLCRLFALYGVPPVHRRLGMVQCHGAYFERAALNAGGIYHTKGWKDYPYGLNGHELAHCWAHLYGKRWNVEGAADLAAAIEDERATHEPLTAASLVKRDDVRETLRKDPGTLAKILIDEDRYLNFEGMPPKELEVAGTKARVFSLVLFRVLGRDGYRELHRRAAKLGHGMSSQEMCALASQIAGRDEKPLFAGWVFAGREGAFKLADAMKDADGDGLSDLDEALYGTDPAKADSDGDGYPDRAEVAAGFDPLDPASPPAGTILVDGAGGDWAGTGVAALDPADENMADADLRDVKVVGDSVNRRLLVRCDYGGPFFADERSRKESYVTLDLSLKRSNDIDYRLNVFFKSGVVSAFDTRGAYTMGQPWGKWKPLDPKGVRSAFGLDSGKGFVELSIPLDLIGAKEPLDLYVTTGAPWEKPVYDALDGGAVHVALTDAQPKLPAACFAPRGRHMPSAAPK